MEDFVFVEAGKEAAFVEMAEQLSYKKLNLVYLASEINKLSSKYFLELEKKFSLDLGFYLFFNEEKSVKKGFFDGVVELCTRKKTISKVTSHVLGAEYTPEKDGLHQRRSGLNHVVMVDLKKRGVIVLFDYGSLRRLDEVTKAKVMGRMRQNVALCKKFGVAYVFVSMAKDVLEMRDVRDVAAFRRVVESL